MLPWNKCPCFPVSQTFGRGPGRGLTGKGVNEYMRYVKMLFCIKGCLLFYLHGFGIFVITFGKLVNSNQIQGCKKKLKTYWARAQVLHNDVHLTAKTLISLRNLIRFFGLRSIVNQVFKLLHSDSEDWLDWVDAQADLRLRRTHLRIFSLLFVGVGWVVVICLI